MESIPLGLLSVYREQVRKLQKSVKKTYDEYDRKRESCNRAALDLLSDAEKGILEAIDAKELVELEIRRKQIEINNVNNMIMLADPGANVTYLHERLVKLQCELRKLEERKNEIEQVEEGYRDAKRKAEDLGTDAGTISRTLEEMSNYETDFSVRVLNGEKEFEFMFERLREFLVTINGESVVSLQPDQAAGLFQHQAPASEARSVTPGPGEAKAPNAETHGAAAGSGETKTPTASGGAGSGAGRCIGWCVNNSFSAVSSDEEGHKTVRMDIDGSGRSFACSKAGAAEAYRAAMQAGDSEAAARAYTMFEIETLREDLELGEGESGITQLGGYHRDVSAEDPSNYESHHIPARSTQDENSDWLPTLSMLEEDHKLTDSYAGKQSRKYSSFFPSTEEEKSYKQRVIDHIGEGPHGYIETVRNELLGIREKTGHRYDGGISAYLDAVIDMVASRGVPKAAD